MKQMRKWLLWGLCCLISTALLYAGEAEKAAKRTGSEKMATHSEAKIKNAAKYIFYFIGDGMSLPQVYLAESALKAEGFDKIYQERTGRPLSSKVLQIKSFTDIGMATTNAENRYITGSAAAATALATGHKTTINTLGMTGDHSANLVSMAEMAHQKGMKVGILTSVSLDHATPAGFYAHVPNRNSYALIDSQLIKADFDYFAGGTVRYDYHKQGGYPEYKAKAADNGYRYVTDYEAFKALDKQSGKVIATLPLFDRYMDWGGALPYNIDLHAFPKEDRISLAEFTEKGIELLDNPKGFFMMIEGGKIDWCGHANDAAASVYETIAFDEAIAKAFAFYEKHPKETLIVITGDHETGGLAMGFAGTHYESAFQKLMWQKVSYDMFAREESRWKEQNLTFEQALDKIQEAFGLGRKEIGLGLSGHEMEMLRTAFDKTMGRPVKMNNEEQYLAYGGYPPVSVTATHILANKAGISWASYSHTALPAPVFAIGTHSDLFNGYYDNTDIAKKIMQVGQLK